MRFNLSNNVVSCNYWVIEEVVDESQNEEERERGEKNKPLNEQ